MKNYYLLEQLRKEYNVTVVVISSELLDDSKKKYFDRFNSYYYFYKSKYSFVKNSLRALLSLRSPIQVELYYFKDIQNKIMELSSKHDLFFCNLVRTARYLESVNNHKYCDMADSIGQNYKKSFKTVSSKFLSLYYFFEYPRLLKYEQHVIDTFDNVFLFNQTEIEYFTNQEKIKYIPHGVNSELLEYPIKDKETKTLAFLGKMDYQPNIDAVNWFVNNVMPKLPNDFVLKIIGAKPTPDVIDLANDRILVTGFVDDPYAIVKSCDVAIAPMVSGGGIQNKVLETLALGMANIVSPLAALPMRDIKNNEHLIIANDVTEWVESIIRVTTDRKCREFLEEEGRKFIKQNHTWDIAFANYQKVLTN
ncbi:glycosyltransferase [Vibrio vulnificus]|nr:glycosyltransferase [Vibrio vulnificus]EHU4943792.1 glycosyltransferase [Vibrio vulnificus]MCU8421639.1 glycosyltransferase family 4 protein [Vibrio vulnificus]MCU8456887.1 glycosyltransferase family 4 protein [Vibrio vulnificus]